jgi:hypothetical protein
VPAALSAPCAIKVKSGYRPSIRDIIVCLIMAVVLQLVRCVWSNLYYWGARNRPHEEYGMVQEVSRLRRRVGVEVPKSQEHDDAERLRPGHAHSQLHKSSLRPAVALLTCKLMRLTVFNLYE